MSKRNLRLIAVLTVCAIAAVVAGFLASGEHLEIIAKL